MIVSSQMRTALIAEPEIPMGTTGATFSHVFGTNTSAFELLAVKRKIMGPCWLDVKSATLSTKSVSIAVETLLTPRPHGARLNSASTTRKTSMYLPRQTIRPSKTLHLSPS